MKLPGGRLTGPTPPPRWRAKVVADLRALADVEDGLAHEYEGRFVAAPPGSAAATAAPNARARAAERRHQADHVEAGTWMAYLASIGRAPTSDSGLPVHRET